MAFGIGKLGVTSDVVELDGVWILESCVGLD